MKREVRDPIMRVCERDLPIGLSLTSWLRTALPAVLVPVIQDAAPPEVADADVAVGLHICFIEVHTRAEFFTTGDLVFRFVVGRLGAFYGFILREIGFGNVIDLSLLPLLGHSTYESHKLLCSPFKMWGLSPSVDSVPLFQCQVTFAWPRNERIPNAGFLADALFGSRSPKTECRYSFAEVENNSRTGRWYGRPTDMLPAQPLESCLPAATYDALLAEDCGLSAGILSTTRAFDKRFRNGVSTGSGSDPVASLIYRHSHRHRPHHARESASARLKFSSSGEKANERTMPARSIKASIGKAVAP